jgi:putative transposase
VLADAEPPRNLGYRIPAFGDLGDRIALELIAEINLPHHCLLSSKLGSKASRKLGATHYGRFADFVDMASDAEQWRRLRMAETSGRPLGSEAWLEALEAQTGRALKPQKRGPKGRNN